MLYKKITVFILWPVDDLGNWKRERKIKLPNLNDCHVGFVVSTPTVVMSLLCSLLVCVSGPDLDAILKATPVLTEKEARSIILQVAYTHTNLIHTSLLSYVCMFFF